MQTILSVDWDFFIEEDPFLDMGHNESAVFFDLLWTERAVSWIAFNNKTVEEMLPFVGPPPLEFVVWLSRYFPYEKCEVCVSESHKQIYDWIKDDLKWRKVEIINFDAHHDLGYKNELEKEVNCGNWGAYLKKDGILKKHTTIYPEWRGKFPEDFSYLQKNGNVFHYFENYKKFARKKKIDAIFICRSGCWVPPVYDSLFTGFTNLLCSGVKCLPERTWSAKGLKSRSKELSEWVKEFKNKNK